MGSAAGGVLVVAEPSGNCSLHRRVCTTAAAALVLSELHPPPAPAGPRDLGLCLFLSRGLEASLWQVEKTGEGVYSFPPNALSFGAWPAWVEHVPGFANSPPGKERREEGRSGLND